MKYQEQQYIKITMMKNRIKIVILLVLHFCIREIYAIDFKVDSILVFSLNWDVLYCTDISCTNFFDYTSGDSCYVIKDEVEINDIIKLLDKLKKTNTTRIDVRSKLFFFSSDTIVCTACTGNNGTLLDGIFYRESEDLKNRLLNLKNLTKYTFKKDKRKDKIEHGKKKLLHKIRQIEKIKKKYNYITNEPILVKGCCIVNAKGKTIKVTLISNDVIVVTKRRIKELEDIFKKHIIWNMNNERMSSDIIPIRIIID